MPAELPSQYRHAHSANIPTPTVQSLQASHEKRQEASRRYFATEDAAKSKEDAKSTDTAEKDAAKDSTTANSPKGPRSGATNDVPIGAEKSNVLFQPTPTVQFDQVFQTLEQDSRRVAYTIFIAIVILDWLFIGGGLAGFVRSLFPASGVATALYWIFNTVGKSAVDQTPEQREPKIEKLKYVPESVEWMNTLVTTIWHTLQQDFFDGIATQVNDTIKPLIPESLPATVKIAKIGHGTRAVRVLSMRSLPDSEFGALVPAHGIDKSHDVDQAKEREKAIEREEGGVFYNLEIAIAYHEGPMRPRKEKMHVDILTMLGPVPIPIFVSVTEFVATLRVRFQMHPDLPFLKNVTFALTENPKINSSVSLGAPWMMDLLNLPIIDNLLLSQIHAAAADFVQPKSMSLDMTVYLGGSDQKENTDAIGLLFINIHRARSLARQDTRGAGADPYLTIAFSKYEKPMYATRIIKGDRNPVWEESAFIMIKAEHVKRQENVLLRLWDSDTMGSDDVSGVCEFSLQELILNSNKMHKREDQLQGDVAGTDAEGVLEWEIGYFPRGSYKPSLRTTVRDPRDIHGELIEVPEEDKTQDATNTIPDPAYPSGILGLTIHQCINVQVKNPGKKSMGQVKVQSQDSEGEELEEKSVSIAYIPSLYVSADINDELVYRTRVKSITNMPTFSSSTETYIRDWRLATLTLGVWDKRRHANDCLVGVVSLKLSDLFHESSSLVKFYDLRGGEGSGRLRISMIFRSIELNLPDNLLGYNVGSFVFTTPIKCTGDGYTSRLKIRVSGSHAIVKSSTAEDDGSHTWQLSDVQASLPVHHRHLSPVVLEFQSGGLTQKSLPGVGRSKHYAVLWLHKLVDNQINEFSLPIYKTDNPLRLIQNVVTESDKTMQLTRVGEARFSGKFKAGIDDSHENWLNDRDRWSTFQAWKAARSAGESSLA